MGVVKPFQAAKGTQLFLWRHGEPPSIAQLLHLMFDVPSGFGRERLDKDGAVGKRPSVQVHQLGDALGHSVGHTCDHKTGVTVPQEHDIIEISNSMRLTPSVMWVSRSISGLARCTRSPRPVRVV